MLEPFLGALPRLFPRRRSRLHHSFLFGAGADGVEAGPDSVDVIVGHAVDVSFDVLT